MSGSKHLFSVFDVTRQVFFRSKLSLGIVNLKPLLPGHVLIIPRRVVPRLADLDPLELNDLFQSVQTVGKAIERAYDAAALTVSIQDGAAAGQSVPHVHVHILPRRVTDFGGVNDQIYPALEVSERGLKDALKGSTDSQRASDSASKGRDAELVGNTESAATTGAGTDVGEDWNVASDEDRRPRSLEEMEKEAQWLASLF